MKSNYLKMYNMHFRDLTRSPKLVTEFSVTNTLNLTPPIWGLLKNSQKNKAITENSVIVL